MPILQQIIDESEIGESQFWHLLREVRAKRGYKVEIVRKEGKYRTFYKPHAPLRSVQAAILCFLNTIPISEHSHGCKGRSSFTHAREHVGKDAVIIMDVKSCFPSIRHSQVLGVFMSIGMTCKDATVLTSFTTSDGHLAQGFLTSPRLQNLLFREIDHRVGILATKEGATYTRYADDLVLSGCHETIRLIGTVKTILRSYGFEVNQDKLITKGVRLNHESQNVCGLVVNRRVNPTRSSLRKCISLVNKLRATSQTGADTSNLRNKIAGHIGYIKSLNRPIANTLSKRRHQATNPSHRGKRYQLRSNHQNDAKMVTFTTGIASI